MSLKWANNARCLNFQMYQIRQMLNIHQLNFTIQINFYLHFVLKSGGIQAVE